MGELANIIDIAMKNMNKTPPLVVGKSLTLTELELFEMVRNAFRDGHDFGILSVDYTWGPQTNADQDWTNSETSDKLHDFVYPT